MGGDQRLVPEPEVKHEYLCHFKNVCYSTKDAKFLYYSDEREKEIIRTVQHKFEHEFADSYLHYNLKSISPQIDIIKQQMPDNDDIKLLSDDIVMHYSLMYYAYNYLFIDHFYAIWRTLKYFDVYDFDTSRPLIFGYETRDRRKDYQLHTQTQPWDHNQISPEKGLKFINELSSYIWSQKPLFLRSINEFKDKESDSGKAIHNDIFDTVFEDITNNDLICFDSIIIEMGYYFRHWDISYFIQLFTQKIHKPKHENPVKQKILILAQNNDDGRRQYTNDTNLEEIGRYLADLFNVEVEIAYSKDVYNRLSLKEQIEWIEQFTVLIHSGGDDSYIHWFMREGTAMITLDWFEYNGKYSVHYDSDNIEFDPLKKTYYYYVTEQDVEIVKIHNHRNAKLDSKNVYRYRLNRERLAKYVYSALLWVEHWNEWGQTFNKPLEIPTT